MPVAQPDVVWAWRLQSTLSLGGPVVKRGDGHTRDLVDLFGREHLTVDCKRFRHFLLTCVAGEEPIGPLFVERYHTTVSSCPPPAVHQFLGRTATSRSTWRCLGGSLAMSVTMAERRCPTTSPSSSSCSSRSICWTRRTWCTRSRQLHASLPNTLFPAPLRNPHRHSRSIPKPLRPLHLHNTVPPRLTSHPHANFCTAHWHKGAILVSGALIVLETRSAASSVVVPVCEVIARVDDLAVITLEHQLLQRHGP